ncbi:MAG: hypothetical protein ACIAXF_07930 [Phycisphaerales bacterium JB063]
MPYILTPIGRSLTKLVRSPLTLARQRRAARVGDMCIQFMDGHLPDRQAKALFDELGSNPEAVEEMTKLYELDRLLYRHFAGNTEKQEEAASQDQ